MSRTEYVFRLRKSIPLLSEAEWANIGPLLYNRIENIKKFRGDTQCSIREAQQNEPRGQRALDLYEALTGYRLDHPDELWAVRISDYGSLCPNCQKPFRTPRAKMCAECGYTLPEGTLAGPLLERDD